MIAVIFFGLIRIQKSKFQKRMRKYKTIKLMNMNYG